MARSLASNALTLLIPLLIGVVAVLIWGEQQYRRPGPSAEAVCIDVAPGTTITGLSEQLAERGVVSNAALFRIAADYTDRAAELKAGSFVVGPRASMENVLTAVTSSGVSTCGTEVNLRIGVTSAEALVRDLDPATRSYVEIARFAPGDENAPAGFESLLQEPGTRLRVTLAEGVTSWQVVESLKSFDILSGSVEEVPAEGTLAPGSYEVQLGDDKAELVARMQARQSAILSDLWAARRPGLPLDTPLEALTLASIVEKETALAEERPTVAAVFVNRLDRGMRLQTDPTVIYGITEGQGTLGRGIRQSELRRATPYNTYVIEGLPPGPIANPGRESIAAALDPADSDYLFFVADGTGGHAFARTLEEHNRNVARWRQIERERQETVTE